MKIFAFLIPGLFLCGCAGSISQNISQAPAPNLTLQDAVAQSEIHKGQPVRWGGTILAVTNNANDTEIEILAEKVDSSGKPLYSNDAQGRFLAKVDGFVDPAIYSRGRKMTAYGLMDALETRKIGEKPYVYPVVKVQKYQLWPNPSESDYADNSNCGPFSLTAVAGIYPYGYRFGYGRCF
ncbi:Slp family lipoprotein [Methylomonas methanica]|uniref:Outer membrane lipoprotein, Slp family n=1 Tax=Methylomonas methanica (strain DSM 25384 / MC09) TaxID=857087 RepID=G0A5F1_METMM|nr:Slp family lipoprotein [Methylomonas methanica]AEG01657.1 outer membrane lipoprotein, Slp family [Methylomonas methanica MC09]